MFQVETNEVDQSSQEDGVASHGDWPWHVALLKEVNTLHCGFD